MLYVIAGLDIDRVYGKLNEYVRVLQEKKPQAAHIHISSTEVTNDALANYAGSMGLFSGNSIIVVTNALEDDLSRRALLESAEMLGASSNVFIVVERELDARARNALKPYAAGLHEYEPAADRRAVPAFNLFALADAFGERNRKTLWIYFMHAQSAAISAEEIHGILSWQVRAMQLALAHNSPDEAGLKPFPYKKARRFAQNFSKEELNILSAGLVTLYHDARRGMHDLNIALERFVLAV